jgi:hypothetical protein
MGNVNETFRKTTALEVIKHIASFELRSWERNSTLCEDHQVCCCMLHLYNLITFRHYSLCYYATKCLCIPSLFLYCCLSGNVFTESLLRNGFGYPCYNLYMIYSVHNKPLSSQYVLFIYSTKVKYPHFKRVLKIIDI